MKKIFSLLIPLLLSTGIAYGGTYISKENPNYTVYYINKPAQLFSIEECKSCSMAYKDIIKCSSTLTTHFYLQGEIVDAKMDEIAKNNYLRNIQETQEKEQNEKVENIKIMIWLFAIVTSFVIAIFGIVLGRKGKITIYLNTKDLIWNSATFYFSLVSVFYIWIVLPALWALYNLFVTIFVFRQGFIKTIVSILTRFWISLFAFLLMISAIPRRKESAEGQMYEFARSAVWATILVAVYNWIRPLADQGEYCLNDNRVWGKRASSVIDIQA